MKQFARLMLLTLGFGLLAALTGLVGPQPKSTNAAIAAAVAVVNTPGVNANQSGPWNVGINGTPNVNIANTPTVNLAPNTTVGVTGGNFSFSNTPQTPIFTRDKDNAALTPFQTVLCSENNINLNPCNSSDVFPVPGGQRAVIEFISSSCRKTGAGWTLDAESVSTSVGGPPAFYSLPLGPSNAFGELLANYQVRIYADQTTDIRLSIGLSNTGNPGFAFCKATLSGYLVSVP